MSSSVSTARPGRESKRKAKPPPTTTPPTPVKLTGWAWKHPNGMCGVLHIVNGSVDNHYLAVQVASCVWQLTQVAVARLTSYLVGVGSKPFCGCDSYKHSKSVRTCKHVEALAALKAQGKL